MAILSEIFDSDNEQPNDGFVDVPPGDYCMQIVHNEVKATKTGTGELLALRWQVCDDTNDYNNQCVFQNINISNSSAEVQRIGRGQLKSICDAIGWTGLLQDVDAIQGYPCLVTVGWSKATADYPAKPEVKRVRPWVPGAPAGKPAPRAVQAPKPAATAKPAPAPAAKPTGPNGANNRPWANRGAPTAA